jgi:hypothetical protein
MHRLNNLHGLSGQGTHETDWRSVTVLPDPDGAAETTDTAASTAVDVYTGRHRLERLTAGSVYRVRVSALNRFGWSRRHPAGDHEFLTAGPKAPSPRFEPSIDTSSSSAASSVVLASLEALVFLLLVLL